MTGDSREPITASSISLYIGFEECANYLVKSMGSVEGKEEELSVLLSEHGERFEQEVLSQLKSDAAAFIDAEEEGEWELPDDFSASLNTIRGKIDQAAETALEEDDMVLVYQAPLRRRIGAWPVTGNSDLIAFWPDDDGLHAHVVEIKSSKDTQPHHEVQAAVYSLMLRDYLSISGYEATVEAGIVHRNSDALNATNPNSFPSIDDLGVVEGDVNRLLREGGRMDEVAEADDVRYRLAGKCNYCLYNEDCFKQAVGDLDFALLGLTEGEQRVLEEHDIESVDELASLKRPPQNPKPWEYRELDSLREAKVQDLMNEPIIGDGLDDMVQNAQGVLGELYEDHPLTQSRSYLRTLQGAGNGTLPKDQPTQSQYDKGNIEYKSGEMIRVYLYIRQDYMRDAVGLVAGRVTRTNYEGDSETFSELSESLPDDDEEKLHVERELLKTSFQKLFQAIRTVAEGRDEIPIHLYFYTRSERDWLVEGIKRHMQRWDSESLGAVRDLLGLRQAIDQPMVGILQDELRERYELKFTSTGLLPVLEGAYFHHCTCGCDGGFTRWEWKIEREDEPDIDLYNAFKPNFFNFRLPYQEADEGFTFQSVQDEDGWYPVRARFDSQFPLEYIWAARGKLDLDWAGGGKQVNEIQQYRWHDADKQERRITPDDIELLGEELCRAIEHVERALGYKNEQYHNAYLGKKPIPLPELPSFTLGESDLRQASQDYIDLEHFSRRQEELRHYAKSPRERVRTGRTAIVRVDRLEWVGEEEQVLHGGLVYDSREFANPSEIANSCRLKGSEGTTSGSRLVANHVDWEEDKQMHEDNKSPQTIEQGVPVEVIDIDIPDREIKIHLSEFAHEFHPASSQYTDYDYVREHRAWHENEHEGNEKPYLDHFASGDVIIVDPPTDDWTAESGQAVYDSIEEKRVPIYESMEQLMEGGYE